MPDMNMFTCIRQKAEETDRQADKQTNNVNTINNTKDMPKNE